jgi:hypothetical protein
MKKFPIAMVILSVVFWLLFVSGSALGGTLESSKYYTWGIDSSELDIPEGSIITEAELVFHNVYNLSTDIINSLSVHLLDNPPLGPQNGDDTGSDDFFDTEGVSVKLLPAQQGYDLVYAFSTNNDGQSWVWDVYDNPFDFQLSDSSQITYTSSLLELIDFAGTGSGFGFGFDHNGAEDCIFNELTLNITVKSYEGAASEQSYVFTPQWIPGGPPALQMSKAVYEANEQIIVNYYNAEENGGVWIALAKASSADTQYLAYTRTDTTADGIVLFNGLSEGGDYVVRMFFNNTFDKAAEVAFSIESTAVPAITTDKSIYATGEDIIVTYTNAEARMATWIALAEASSGLSSYITWSRTDGTSNGNVTFGGLSTPGAYKVRLFFNNVYDLAADAEFTVEGEVQTDPVISMSKSSYASGEDIVVNYADVEVGTNVLITLAQAGTADTSVISQVQTDGSTDGSVNFSGLSTTGNYVARLFLTDLTDKVDEVAFEILEANNENDPAVTTNKSVYEVGEDIIVTYVNAEARMATWIALAETSSGLSSYITWSRTDGTSDGSVIFDGLSTPGTYKVRLFFNNVYDLAADVEFEVQGGQAQTDPALAMESSSYLVGENIIVNYSNVEAGTNLLVALAQEGTADTSIISLLQTDGSTDGSVKFSGLSVAGNYVARLFLTGFNNKIDEVAFQVRKEVDDQNPSLTMSKSVYTAGESIVVNYANSEANLAVWIALAEAGSADTRYITWSRTDGTANGSVNFSGLNINGSYVARLFFHNVFDKAAETTFNVQDAGSVVTTGKNVYTVNEDIVVNYEGSEENFSAWLALSNGDATVTEYITWSRTNGTASGSAVFAGLTEPGNYKARLYFHNVYDLAAEYNFTVE